MLERIFLEAEALPASGRAAFLTTACGEDIDLRAHIERLLTAGDRADQVFAALGERLKQAFDYTEQPTVLTGQRAGPYLLESLIGSGGMGDVFLARRVDDEYSQRVAVKTTRLGLASEHLVTRFRRERQILASLEHPNIARLLDGGVLENGCPYMVMEYVGGEPVDRVVNRSGLSGREVARLMLPVFRAVEYAHANLVVHCDLKPSNILVTPEGNPKLVDFGIARLLRDDESQVTSVALTPRYAAPELRSGSPATIASDVYSLGAVLRELSGPLPEGDEQALIIAKAVAEDTGFRYPSVEALRSDVELLLTGRPVSAHRPTVAYRARKLVTRYPWATAGISAAVMALITVTIVAMLQSRRAEAELARANKVTEFLSSIMGVVPGGSPTSLRSRGASLRVVDLVDAVASRMQSELTDQPETEATIRYLAGAAYHQIGQDQKALPHVRRSVELWRIRKPAHDESRVEAEILAATVDGYLGHWEGAERQLLETRRNWRNPMPFTVAAAETMLGVAQHQLGKAAEAERTLEQCIARMKTGLGEDSPWLGVAMSNLALVYQARGEFHRQKSTLEKAVAVARARRAEAPDSLGWASLNLAVAGRILDEPALVRASALESISAFREASGPDSPPEAQALTQLAWAKVRLSEADAESTARKALAIQTARLPKDHNELAVGLTWLGYVLLEKGKLAEARLLLDQAVSVRKRTFPSQDWRTSPAAGFLGEAMVRLGEKASGEVLLRECRDALRKQFGDLNPRTRDAQARLDRWLKH